MEALEILKYILPAVVVFFTAYYILKTFLDNQRKKQELEMKMNSQKMIVPMRLQAYERLILLMERISPEHLVLRSSTPGVSARQLQAQLLQTIRNEFDHNLAQQMYVSSNAWGLINNAKEEIVKIINTSATQLNENGQAHELSTLILEKAVKYERFPTRQATEVLKKEVRELF